MHILVADGLVEHRRPLVAQIQELGHTVEEALGEREVLDICRRKCPDLLLIDWVLAGVPGVEIVQQIRQLGGTAVWVPIVLMGNRLSEEEILQSVDAGVDDFLSKPVSASLLKARIRSAERHQNLKEEVFSVAHNLVVANRALENVVSRDALTGIGNLSGFESALEQEWTRAEGYQTSLALMMLNLDYFKLYNETYGVEKGDEAIKQVAKALNDQLLSLGRNFFFARVTGATFALLIPGISQDQAIGIAAQCTKAVEALNIPHAKSGCSNHVTISVGLVLYHNKNFKQPWDFKEEADYALFQAKHHGRNRYFLTSTAA